jgi:hypothetical protein
MQWAVCSIVPIMLHGGKLATVTLLVRLLGIPFGLLCIGLRRSRTWALCRGLPHWGLRPIPVSDHGHGHGMYLGLAHAYHNWDRLK